MDDQTLIKTSKDLTLSYLENINAVISETDGLFSIDIPPEYEKIFNGIKKRITFDASVADIHSCEFVVPGSNFLAIILREIIKKAPVVSGVLQKESGGPSAHIDKIKVHDGSASLINSSEEENLAIRFYFQLNIKSIKSTSMLKWIDLDLKTLEELEFPSYIDLKNKKIKNKFADVQIDACFSKATEILDRDIKPTTTKFTNLTNENLQRDMESLEISHEKRITEIKQDIWYHENKLKEFDRKILRARNVYTRQNHREEKQKQEKRIKQEEDKSAKQIDRLYKDKELQTLQIHKRYTPIIDSSLIAAQIFSYSNTKCTLEIKTKYAQNQVIVEFDDSYQNFRVNCNNCNKNSEQINLCINSHVGCNLCTQQCVKCKKDVCEKCSHQFNPCYICREGLCNDCSTKCNFCSELTCSTHIMQCPHCSQTLCYFCSDNCEICTKRFCNQTITECITCKKRLCQEDSVACMLCDRSICSNDTQTCGICSEVICKDDTLTCQVCKQMYSKNCVRGDNCITCSNMRTMSVDDVLVSEVIKVEPDLRKFKKWEGASNSKIAVFKAKKMFGSRIIVFDVLQKQILSKDKKGLL